MKKIVLSAIVTVIVTIVNAQAPIMKWAKSMKGNSHSVSNAIAVDASGNVYTTGVFLDSVNFSPGTDTSKLVSKGGWDIFICKSNVNGNLVWAKRIGDYLDDVATSIFRDRAGNIYITGTFKGTVDFNPGAAITNLTSTAENDDLFILKLNAAGNFVWAKDIGGSGNIISESVSVDTAGNVYTTGSFNGTGDFDPGVDTFHLATSGNSADIFISKLDKSGNFVWAKSIGDSLDDKAYAIKTDVTGNIYITGSFEGTVDFDPNAGIYPITSATSGSNMFVSKLDTAGNFVWVKNIGGISDADFVQGSSIALDATGSIYTTGYFRGAVDFDPGIDSFNIVADTAFHENAFVLKLDTLGNFMWAGAATGFSNGQSIALDAADNAYITGYFSGTVDFDPGADTFNLIYSSTSGYAAFIWRVNATGSFSWATGLNGYSYGQAIAVDAAKNVYTTGAFKGVVDFDPTRVVYELNAGHHSAIFIQKLRQSLTGIDEYSKISDINLYPNPSTTNFTITFDATETTTTVEIINLLGELIYSETLKIATSKQIKTIDVSVLANGIYFVQLKNKSVVTSVKFIKE